MLCNGKQLAASVILDPGIMSKWNLGHKSSALGYMCYELLVPFSLNCIFFLASEGDCESESNEQQFSM